MDSDLDPPATLGDTVNLKKSQAREKHTEPILCDNYSAQAVELRVQPVRSTNSDDITQCT